MIKTKTERARELFKERQYRLHQRVDRIFAVLMFVQWIAGILFALIISPKTWIGTENQTHLHLWAAILLGGAISLFPIIMVKLKAGHPFTRQVIAIGQMMMSALLIHLTGGRIETHFHVFGSLAFLAFYRDHRVLISATLVVAADHFIRGIFFPQSVFGVLTASSWRWVEHAAWVIFENIFLFFSIQQGISEMREMAERQAQLEHNNSELLTINQKMTQITDSLMTMSVKVKDSSSQVKDISIELVDSNRQLENDSEKVNLSVHDMASIMAELSANISAISKNIDSQSSSVIETSSTIKRMADSLKVISQGSRNLSTLADRARNDVQQGKLSVESAAIGMHQINNSITDTASTMQQLGERAVTIGNIVAVINNISDQTNLLALNAAIEAARAGSQGLGFAVVAEEVRKLSERTARSSEEITQLISSVQKDIKRGIDQMERSIGLVGIGIDQSNNTVNALSKIDNVVNEVAVTSTQIDEVIMEQAVGIEQVLQTSQELTVITTEIQAATQEQTFSSTELVKIVERVREAAEGNAILCLKLSRISQAVLKQAEMLTEMVNTDREAMPIINKDKNIVPLPLPMIKHDRELMRLSGD